MRVCLINSRVRLTRGGTSAWLMGQVPTTLSLTNSQYYKTKRFHTWIILWYDALSRDGLRIKTGGELL
jgi:hypothetical protein